MKLKRLFIPALICTTALILPCGTMYSDFSDGLSKSSSSKEITAFSFPSVGAVGTISGTDIAVTVPFGTDVTALVAEFTTTGQSVEVAAMQQISGWTDNDFSTPVTYIVTAADGSTRDYTVTVSVAPSTAKDITDFVILGIHGSITSDAISLTVPYGTVVTSLIPTIAITGASVSPASGASQDFSSPVTYTVTAADGSTKDYTVTVSLGYTVTYNGNGYTAGAVPLDINLYHNGNTVTVQGNTGDLRGPAIQAGTTQRLVAWNTMANGSGTDYTPGTGTFTMGSGNVTLYARWTTNASVIGKIGPAGGFVFYDYGSYTGSPTWRYMEAAPLDAASAIWGCDGYTSNMGANNSGIGYGYQNTLNIVAGCPDEDIGAKVCNAYIFNGFNDWYLPSIDELWTMYSVLYLNGIGGFSGTYLSSTEIYWAPIWDCQVGDFTGNYKYVAGRGSLMNVRPARRF